MRGGIVEGCGRGGWGIFHIWGGMGGVCVCLEYQP